LYIVAFPAPIKKPTLLHKLLQWNNFRFGFDDFQQMAENNDCEIIVVNQESLSPRQEMVEDLMAMVHTFSCR